MPGCCLTSELPPWCFVRILFSILREDLTMQPRLASNPPASSSSVLRYVLPYPAKDFKISEYM